MIPVPPTVVRRNRVLRRDAIVLIAALSTVGWAFVGWKFVEYREGAEKRRRKVKELIILNNLRMLSVAVDHYYLEHGTKPLKLNQVIGPDKRIKQLVPVDGEDYSTLDFALGKSWRIASRDGIVVTYKR